MTSKISFRKLLKEDMKKRMWLFAVSLVLFVIIIPIFVSLQLEGELANAEAMGMGGLESVKNSFARTMGFDSALILGVMLLATVGGISSFSFLHSGKQTDFYHSLPVKRKTWFAVSSVSTLIHVMAPYLAGYWLLYFIGSAKGVVRDGLIRQCPYILLVVTIFYLLIYSTTALVMMMTGKLIAALLGLGVIMFYGPLVGGIFRYIMQQRFVTYVSEGNYAGLLGNLSGKSEWLSPVLAYVKFTSLYNQKRPQTAALLGITAAAFLLLLAAYLLYRIRPSEAAGKAIAFVKLETVIKVILSVTCGVMFGTIAGSQNRTQGMNGGWLFGVGILAAVLAFAVIEFIYHMDLKMIFKRKISLLVTVLSVVAIFSVIKYDLLGYDSYFPKKEKLEAMSMDVPDLRNQWSSLSYNSSDEYLEILKSLRTEDFNSIYELAQNGVEQAKAEKMEGEYVTIAFYLKNGKTKYRSYWVDDNLAKECLEEFLQNDEYRENMFGFKQLDTENVTHFEVYNLKQNQTALNLNKEQQEKLLETYKKELKNNPLQILEEKDIIGEINYHMQDKNGRTILSGGWNIYREFHELRQLLTEYGCSVMEEIKAEDIAKMTICDYRSAQDTTDEKEITDEEEIGKFLKKIYYKDGSKTDPGYYLEIEFKNGEFATYSLSREK